MKKIVITTTSFGEYDKRGLDLLKKKGFKVVLNPYGRKLKEDEILSLCDGAVGIIAGTENLDSEVLKKLKNIKVISRCGAGMDNVDLTAAKRLNIKVLATPDAPTIAVAELTLGLILNILRKTVEMDGYLKGNLWTKKTGSLLRDKKVAVIGFGRIGKKVALLLKAFNCEIAYVDPIVKAKFPGIKRLSKKEALKWADIVTCHASTKECLIRKSDIMSMKKGGWIINVSRGGVIDEKALYDALKSGHLSGAALDVFFEEPYNGALKKLSNVILTPHVGSYAKETRIEMELEAVKNLLNALKQKGQKI